MKGLVFVRVNFSIEANHGIWLKCQGQLGVLKKHFPDTDFLYLKSNGIWLNDQLIHNWPSKTLKSLSQKAKLYTFELGQILTRIVDLRKYDFLYFRYTLSSPSLFYFLKKIKTAQPNIKIIADFPTYPYEQEFKSIVKSVELKVDQYHRKKIFKLIDRIAHLGQEKIIYDTATLAIGNGINKDDFPVASQHTDWKQLRLIAVGNFNTWHGVDRLLNGIHQREQKHSVNLRIIGSGWESIKKLTGQLNLDHQVSFYTPLTGNALDEHFGWANFGVGTLGIHRKNVTINQSLKHREYAARGLNFVFAGNDPGFQAPCPGIINIEENETPVNIEELMNQLANHTEQIRTHCDKYLNWEEQMKTVIQWLTETLS